MVEVPWHSPVRVLAFGDSNTWGFATDLASGQLVRLRDEDRWAGVAQAALGHDVKVLVDAVSGRRTDVDADVQQPIVASVAASALNGLAHAEVAGLAQAPLDLVIVMLGTNDLAIDPPRPVPEIAAACVRVAKALVRGATAFTPGRVPRALLVCPPPLGHGAGSEAVPRWPDIQAASRALAPALAEAAQAEDMGFVDAGEATGVEGPDGVHLSVADHRRLGLAIAAHVRTMLGR